MEGMHAMRDPRRITENLLITSIIQWVWGTCPWEPTAYQELLQCGVVFRIRYWLNLYLAHIAHFRSWNLDICIAFATLSWAEIQFISLSFEPCASPLLAPVTVSVHGECQIKHLHIKLRPLTASYHSEEHYFKAPGINFHSILPHHFLALSESRVWLRDERHV